MFRLYKLSWLNCYATVFEEEIGDYFCRFEQMGLKNDLKVVLEYIPSMNWILDPTDLNFKGEEVFAFSLSNNFFFYNKWRKYNFV